MHSVVIAPSILSANLMQLGQECTNVLNAGADWLHFDVMDNHYVPNLTFGPDLCKSLREYGIKAPIDVHLMINPVNQMLERFANAGATSISFHPDTTDDLEATIKLIRQYGCKVGIVFNPQINLDLLPAFKNKVDMVLLMSVNPGFGGQKFMPHILDKARQARKEIDTWDVCPRLQIDGGVNLDNIQEIALAGIDTFVAGFIFRQPMQDYKSTIDNLRIKIAGARG